MSRSWLGRPTGRHAAGRGRAGKSGSTTTDQTAPPPPQAGGAQADATRLFGAPTLADAPPLVSPVTDEARAATQGTQLPAHMPPGATPLITIDALGRKCPIPIIMLAEQIRDIPVGSVIAVLADDPAAYTDVPAWCGLKSHDCVFRADYETGWSFGIRRRY